MRFLDERWKCTRSCGEAATIRDVRRALFAAGLLWLAFAGVARAERAWLAPEQLTAPGWHGGSHHVEVAADGTVVAAWVTQPRDPYAQAWRSPVMVLVRPPGRAAQPVEIGANSTGSVNLAANRRGDAVAVWHDLESSRLMIARRAAGAPAFGAPEALPGPPQITSNESQVAIDELGNVAVADRDGAAYERGGTFLASLGCGRPAPADEIDCSCIGTSGTGPVSSDSGGQ